MSTTDFSDTSPSIKAVIDGDDPLRELYPFFDRRTDALRYYVGRMKERHASGVVDGACEACEDRPADRQASATWRAIVSDHLGASAAKHVVLTPLYVLAALPHIGSLIGLLLPGATPTPIEMTTYHPVCCRCARRIRIRYGFAAIASYALGAIVLACAMGIVVGIVWMIQGATDRHGIDLVWIGLGMLVTVGSTVVTAAINHASRRIPGLIALPHGVRCIGRSPFYLFHRMFLQ